MARYILTLFLRLFAVPFLIMMVTYECLTTLYQEKRAITQSLSKELEAEQKVFVLWLLSDLFGGLYLTIWIVAQWVVAQIVSYFQLSGIDFWLLLAIQGLLAVGTLTPIIAHISLTLVRSFAQTRRAIRKELEECRDCG